MRAKRKHTLVKELHHQARKYSRWMRLYIRRVRAVEREIGGPIESC